jgi:hypothetical protein
VKDRTILAVGLAAFLIAVGVVVAQEVPASGATITARPEVTFKAANVDPVAATHTGSTSFSLVPDSGTSGNTWAYDTYTESWSVTRHSQVANGHCGAGAKRCYSYGYGYTDKGTTTTIAGQVSPGCNGSNCATVEDLAETVSFNGGGKGNFYSSYKRFYTADVPTAYDANGSADGLTADIGQASWFEQGQGARFGGSDLPVWGWTYAANAGADHQCPAYTGKWVNAVAGDTGNVLAPNTTDCSAQS